MPLYDVVSQFLLCCWKFYYVDFLKMITNKRYLGQKAKEVTWDGGGVLVGPYAPCWTHIDFFTWHPIALIVTINGRKLLLMYYLNCVSSSEHTNKWDVFFGQKEHRRVWSCHLFMIRPNMVWCDHKFWNILEVYYSSYRQTGPNCISEMMLTNSGLAAGAAICCTLVINMFVKICNIMSSLLVVWYILLLRHFHF